MTKQSKYTLLDILMATPFEKRLNLSGSLTASEFFDDYFVNHKLFVETKLQLEDYLLNKPWQLPFFCFLEGYAGTGKTTFIHWFARNSSLDMQFAFIDLGIAKTFTHKQKDTFSGEDLFEDFFIKILSLIYYKCKYETVDILHYLHKKQVPLSSYFNKDFFHTLNRYYDPSQLGEISDPAFIDFLNNIKYTEMFLICMLIYNRHPEIIKILSGVSNCKNSNELTLFLDNMDSMKMEDKSCIIPKDIASLYHEHYLKIIQDFGNFFSDKKINFVFCMRDSVYSVINPQHSDFFKINHLHFSIEASHAKKIFFTRKHIAYKYKIHTNSKSIKLLSYIYRDKLYLSRSYLPLFNYNIRKFANFILNQNISPNKLCIDTYHQLMYPTTNQSSKQQFVVGARGMIYYLVIKSMHEKDFISDNLITREGLAPIPGNVGLLNISRIILTIIHNLTQYQLDIENENERCKPTNLLEVYNEFSKVYNNHHADFINTLCALFLFHEANWCHLVTFSNFQVYNQDHIDSVTTKLKEFEKIKNNLFKNNIRSEVEKELSSIKIRINSSGYIYLKDIIRHFEYHSVKAGNRKPLFASISYNRVENYYEFNKVLESTTRISFSCVKTLSDFLENSNFAFESSAFCFRIYSQDDALDDDNLECYQTTRPGQLLINRIIDTHVNYIDIFRQYVLSNSTLIEQYSCEQNLKKEIIMEDINSSIVNIIQQYVNKYYTKNDKTIENLKKLQQQNINKILNDSLNNIYTKYINYNRSTIRNF